MLGVARHAERSSATAAPPPGGGGAAHAAQSALLAAPASSAAFFRRSAARRIVHADVERKLERSGWVSSRVPRVNRITSKASGRRRRTPGNHQRIVIELRHVGDFENDLPPAPSATMPPSTAPVRVVACAVVRVRRVHRSALK